MATQTSIFTFTGKLGDVIGYRRNGTHFFRSMPQTVRQTAATKRAAHNFGLASKKGRLIRSAFAAELDLHCDSAAVNRLNGMLVKARNNHCGIAGFQFNGITGVDRFFPVTPAFTKDGTLHIPAQQLRRYKGIDKLEIKLVAVRIHFAERRVTGMDAAVLYIDPRQPFEGAALSVDVPSRGALVVMLQVRGWQGENVSGSRKYQAADIIAVVNQQTQQVFQKPAYSQAEIWKRRPAHSNKGCAPIQRGTDILVQRE